MRISSLALCVAFGGLCAVAVVALSASSASACVTVDYGSVYANTNDTDGDGLNDSVYFFGSVHGGGGDAYINVTLVDDLFGWTADENTTGRITPGPSLFGGTSFSLKVTAWSYWFHDTYTLYTSLDDTNGPCDSRPYYSIELYPLGSYLVGFEGNETNATVEEGGSATYELNVTNLGNNPDNITFYWYPDPGWTGSASPTLLPLDIGASGFVNITITAPHNAAPLYTNQMVVYAGSTRNQYAYTTVTLNTTIAAQRFGVTAAPLQGTGSAVPGGSLNVTANVTNLGNNRDNISLAVSAAPPGWTATLAAPNIFLDAGATQTVTVTIMVPVSLTGAITWAPTLTATAGDSVANSSATLNASILLPDFSVVTGDISVSNPTPTAGDAVAVDVTVRNVGTPIALDIAVRLSDGHTTLSKTITVALAGTAVASFSWTAVVGVTRLTVTADASNAIPEVSESNNAATVSVTVHAANVPPVAEAANATAAARPGEAVTISAAGSSDADGTIAAYDFDFGDGNSSGWVTTSSVTHTYGVAGVYTVKIRVRDNSGAESDNATSTVTIIALAPPPKSPGFDAPFALAAVAATAGLAAVLARNRRRMH